MVSNGNPRSKSEEEKAQKEERIEKVTRHIMAVTSRDGQSVVSPECAVAGSRHGAAWSEGAWQRCS